MTSCSSSPSTLTILPTYRCTAACEQCCFGSNPHLTDRLSLESIIQSIRQAKQDFKDLRVVVFSGGECTMLGDDLLRAISFATDQGLSTRIVTNAHWGAGTARAAKFSKELQQSGLKELNVSTGLDHMKYVPLESVVNAARHAIELKIFIPAFFINIPLSQLVS